MLVNNDHTPPSQSIFPLLERPPIVQPARKFDRGRLNRELVGLEWISRREDATPRREIILECKTRAAKISAIVAECEVQE